MVVVDKICTDFLRQADCDQQDFWKPAVLEPVVEIICLTFEELSTIFHDNPSVQEAFLYQISIIYNQNLDPMSGYTYRKELIEEMMLKKYLSLDVVLPVIRLVDFSLGNYIKLEKLLRLTYIQLKNQKPALRKLMGICLDYFEAEVRGQIAAKAAAEAQIEAAGVREPVAEAAPKKSRRRPREVEPQAADELEKRPRRAAFLAAQRMLHAVPDAADAAVEAPQPPAIRA